MVLGQRYPRHLAVALEAQMRGALSIRNNSHPHRRVVVDPTARNDISASVEDE
jgi:hypothetical protein